MKIDFEIVKTNKFLTNISIISILETDEDGGSLEEKQILNGNSFEKEVQIIKIHTGIKQKSKTESAKPSLNKIEINLFSQEENEKNDSEEAKQTQRDLHDRDLKFIFERIVIPAVERFEPKLVIFFTQTERNSPYMKISEKSYEYIVNSLAKIARNNIINVVLLNEKQYRRLSGDPNKMRSDKESEEDSNLIRHVSAIVAGRKSLVRIESELYKKNKVTETENYFSNKRLD